LGRAAHARAILERVPAIKAGASPFCGEIARALAHSVDVVAHDLSGGSVDVDFVLDSVVDNVDFPYHDGSFVVSLGLSHGAAADGRERDVLCPAAADRRARCTG
jgi:hypothetical protein